MEYNKIYQGDALEVLKTFPDESIDLIITSPPYYALRNYGVDGQIGLEETFDEYLNKILKITAELKRVLKKTGQLWWNHGDSYGGLPAGNKKISEANIGKDGLFVRKMKANEGAKSFVGFDKKNYGGLHKNQNTMKQGRGRKGNQASKCLLLQPERLAIKMIDEQGWILRNKVIWTKQILLKKENKTVGSCMPTSVKDRFNETWEYLYFFVKNKKYYSNLDAVRLPFQYWGIVDNRPSDLILGAYRQKGEGYTGSKYNKFDFLGKSKAYNWSLRADEGRFDNWKQKAYKGKFLNIENPEEFNSPRARALRKSLEERMEDTKDKNTKQSRAYNVKKLLSEIRVGKKDYFNTGKNIPSVWQINPEPHNFQKELGVETDHFAAFPQALCEIPIKFGCPEDGIVLDPFAGSGTALVVAKRLGRKYIGIELNPDYFEIAKRRLDKVVNQLEIEVASK